MDGYLLLSGAYPGYLGGILGAELFRRVFLGLDSALVCSVLVFGSWIRGCSAIHVAVQEKRFLCRSGVFWTLPGVN